MASGKAARFLRGAGSLMRWLAALAVAWTVFGALLSWAVLVSGAVDRPVP
jgi:hypothetical protein